LVVGGRDRTPTQPDEPLLYHPLLFFFFSATPPRPRVYLTSTPQGTARIDPSQGRSDPIRWRRRRADAFSFGFFFLGSRRKIVGLRGCGAPRITFAGMAATAATWACPTPAPLDTAEPRNISAGTSYASSTCGRTSADGASDRRLPIEGARGGIDQDPERPFSGAARLTSRA